MLIYILKSSACLLAFMAFYTFFLERESMHTFKRFYLLSALILSFSIPLITFTQYVEIYQPINQTLSIEPSITHQETTNYLPIVLWSIYGLGFIVFGIRFLKNLLEISFKIKRNPKLKNTKTTRVLLQESIIPHTFFSFIFLNKQKYDAREIPNEVILHEETHATQKHSIDILIIELVQILFWFNPLIYLIKHYIKLNHEFLADNAVLNKGIEPSKYQKTLLAFSSSATCSPMANAINYSLIKKRFTIMKTKTSKQAAWIRSFILLPLLAILIFSFSTKEQIEQPLEAISSQRNLMKINPIEANSLENQQKATPKEIAEYNKLAKYYNAQSENERIIKLKDLKRLKYLYGKMSKEQKANAEPFPNFPPPPAAPKAPKTKKAPKSPKAPKAEKAPSVRMTKNAELPPPPPIPADATPKQKAKYKKAIANYKKKKDGYAYKHKTKKGESVEVAVIPDEEMLVPPPPPKSPLDHVIEMSKKGAKFSYNGKSISSDKAIALLKKKPNLNISTTTNNGKSTVKIQDKPIVIKN